MFKYKNEYYERLYEASTLDGEPITIFRNLNTSEYKIIDPTLMEEVETIQALYTKLEGVRQEIARYRASCNHVYTQTEFSTYCIFCGV